jgi:hypothetical protein
MNEIQQSEEHGDFRRRQSRRRGKKPLVLALPRGVRKQLEWRTDMPPLQRFDSLAQGRAISPPPVWRAKTNLEMTPRLANRIVLDPAYAIYATRAFGD